ncbi:inositol polyphosphate multikinase isoform X2 [Ooceraea biroi]|uniref:inositol polyphosphate multikinase isoform X2 n=1 Tax=Ooceraea biroi TaxID=2015173 RepID=UPI0005BB1B51|nr:inositol polyphosphate multikinase isoform X2 [Ooceraea biroi]
MCDYQIIATAHPLLIMTTLESQSGENLCHLDKLPHVKWNNSISGSPACTFPDGLSPLDCQMAGHPFDGEKHTIGMLVSRRNGHVLKPATKAILGEREIAFYENLKNSQDSTIAPLKEFVPHYYGTTELRVFNKRTKFLTLRDITEGMAEPCVMDIKIGRRTWDPLATPEKRATEELKYAESKRAYGFCITGFQVYCLSTGRLKKFDKDYGKKLDAKGVVEALKTFLHITPEKPACQRLIIELLSILGRIMLFFRMQRKYRFYSSSLLVAYDARELRQHRCLDKKKPDDPTNPRTKSAYSDSNSLTSHSIFNTNETETQTVSTASVSSADTKSNCTREQMDKPLLKKSISSGPVSIKRIIDRSDACNPNQMSRSCPNQLSLQELLDNLKDDDATADPTVLTNTDKCNWVRVNMIDFTHVFSADDDSSLDLNCLEGIENLIELLKTFIPKTCKVDSEQERSCINIAQ